MAPGTVSSAGRRVHDTATAVDAVRRIFRALRNAAQQTRAHAGMSVAQLSVLWSLAGGEASSLTELGERTHTDRSSVTDVVERLARMGLVKRFRSGEDRRRTRVRITPAGRVLLGTAPGPCTELLVAGLGAMDDDELHALAAGLLRLTITMGLAAAPAPLLLEDKTACRPTARERIRNG